MELLQLDLNKLTQKGLLTLYQFCFFALETVPWRCAPGVPPAIPEMHHRHCSPRNPWIPDASALCHPLRLKKAGWAVKLVKELATALTELLFFAPLNASEPVFLFWLRLDHGSLSGFQRITWTIWNWWGLRLANPIQTGKTNPELQEKNNFSKVFASARWGSRETWCSHENQLTCNPPNAKAASRSWKHQKENALSLLVSKEKKRTSWAILNYLVCVYLIKNYLHHQKHSVILNTKSVVSFNLQNQCFFSWCFSLFKTKNQKCLANAQPLSQGGGVDLWRFNKKHEANLPHMGTTQIPPISSKSHEIH